MNPAHEPLPPLDPQALDLLADGELPEADRQRLLATLDQVPGAWRACALAFLQAQCWRDAMRRSTAAAVPAMPLSAPAGQRAAAGLAPVVPGGRPLLQRTLRYGGLLLAMAASFLVAMVVVGHVRQTWRGYPLTGSGETPLAEASAPSPIEPPKPPETLEPAVPATTRPDAAARSWRLVTLGVPGEPQGAGRAIQLPAIEAEHFDESLLRPGAEAMPAELRDALRQMGYETRQDRQLLPVRLRDGRRLVVPVDQVEVHYVGNRAFQ